MKRAGKYITIVTGVMAVIISLALFVAIHSTTKIVVLDESGLPVAGAEVFPQSLSINYAKVITDAHGEVRLPLVSQSIHWVRVEKSGYQAGFSGEIGNLKKVVVVLGKEPIQPPFEIITPPKIK